MKQLKHLKVGGSSYFIEGDSVIYAGNDGVKYVCGNQILQIYGYPEGLGSFTEPDFLKVGNKYVNRDRIIAYTNTGIALNTGTQYFETINYTNDNEYKNLCKYFDPTDSTAIDGWNIVKNKVCSFEPGSSNINGQIAEDIKPVAPTPPGPTPGEVTIEIVGLYDETYHERQSIEKNGEYRLMLRVNSNVPDTITYLREHLRLFNSYLGEDTVFAVYEYTESPIANYMVDFNINIDVIYGGYYALYVTFKNEPRAEFPISITPSDLIITSAGWASGMDCFDVKVNNEGSFTSELRARLNTDCTDMDSSYYAQISNISQTGATEYLVVLNNPYNITGIVHLYDNGVQIAEHNFSPEPPSGPQPQTGEDFDITLSSEQMFTPGETSDYEFYKDYGQASITIRTGYNFGVRNFGASYANESFWNIPNYGDVNTYVYLPGTNQYATPGASEPRDEEQITIFNFTNKPSGEGHQLEVNISLTDYDYVTIGNGKWTQFSYTSKNGWVKDNEGLIQ